MDAVTPWYVPVARAVVALILATVVTFTADHSATLGLVTFGSWGIASGAVLSAVAIRAERRGTVRSITLVQGLTSVLAGVVAVTVSWAGLPFLIFLVSAVAAITGFLELYVGVRGRGRERSARDQVFVGALTIALAVAALLVPPGLNQQFTGPDGVARALTASVVMVGALGAYWAIVGVYLMIGGLSLRWADRDSRAAAAAETAS